MNSVEPRSQADFNLGGIRERIADVARQRAFGEAFAAKAPLAAWLREHRRSLNQTNG